MNVNIIKENIDITIDKYPYFKSINKTLMDDIDKMGYDDTSGYRKNDTAKFSITTLSPAADTISDWVSKLISIKYEITSLPLLSRCFFTRCDKGDFVGVHNHFPDVFSWVYYVNTPRGSSPLVFTTSNKKIKAEEGQVLIFPSLVKHHVPFNRCDARISLVGNVIIEDQWRIK
tara:strand:+ start:125 stop:643 length:519 start_codon:yes stop_codon:yes gene_type:complete